jgi:hypothetical protein
LCICGEDGPHSLEELVIDWLMDLMMPSLKNGINNIFEKQKKKTFCKLQHVERHF